MFQQTLNDPYGLLNGVTLAPLKDVNIRTTSRLFGSGAAVGPNDSCSECAGPLKIRDLSYECSDCSAVFEAADIRDVIPVSTYESPGSSALRGRLRVVGANAGWFQLDLDRANPSETSDTRKKSTYSELLRLNTAFSDRGGHPFPLDVLAATAETYYTVQQNSVRRSQMKKSILAALVCHQCVSHGFTRTRIEAASFAGLMGYGIARGDDFLRSIDEDEGLDIDLDCDRLKPHVISAFALLDLGDAIYDPLRSAVTSIVSHADDTDIGFSSVLRSKVIAAMYDVLRRKKMTVTLDVISSKCKIRKHTLQRFLDELAAFHSHFKPIFRKYGLIDCVI